MDNNERIGGREWTMREWVSEGENSINTVSTSAILSITYYPCTISAHPLTVNWHAKMTNKERETVRYRTKWKRQATTGIELLADPTNLAAVQGLIRSNPYWANCFSNVNGQSLPTVFLAPTLPFPPKHVLPDSPDSHWYCLSHLFRCHSDLFLCVCLLINMFSALPIYPQLSVINIA